MSALLTPNQKAIFDDTIRSRAAASVTGDEDGLNAVPSRGSKERRPERMKKGDDSKKAMADTSEPVYALDKNDPNYNSEEEPYKLKATQAFPRTDVIVQYKDKVGQLVEEYFSSGDIMEVDIILESLEQPLYQHYFVKRLVTMAMDRGNREKEAAAALLSALYPHAVIPEQLQRGFQRLLESVDDLAIDVPEAAEVLALFLARGVIDDILPPALLTSLSADAAANGEVARETLRLAHGHLAGRHSHERVLRAWADTSKTPLEDAKKQMGQLLAEFISSGDTVEARRCLRSIHAPFFHHELVKKCCTLCVEAPEGGDSPPRLLGLLKVLGDSGEVSASQMAKGFARMTAYIDDLSLDVPNAHDRLAALTQIALDHEILSKDDLAAAAAAAQDAVACAPAAAESAERDIAAEPPSIVA